jgi:hypothetical protein
MSSCGNAVTALTPKVEKSSVGGTVEWLVASHSVGPSRSSSGREQRAAFVNLHSGRSLEIKKSGAGSTDTESPKKKVQ